MLSTSKTPEFWRWCQNVHMTPKDHSLTSSTTSTSKKNPDVIINVKTSYRCLLASTAFQSWQCVSFPVAGLQLSVLSLDNRVQILEENGGGGDNSSVTELETRVTDLEMENADQEDAIESNMLSIAGMFKIVAIFWVFQRATVRQSDEF